MLPDVTEAGGSEQGINDGVNRRVGVAPAVKSLVVGYFHSS
jgi:hypothetical protein